MGGPASATASAPPPGPSFRGPAVPTARASAPVSAPPVTDPPVVPAPALPSWPPSTSSTGGGAFPAGATPAARAAWQRGRELAGPTYGGTDGPGFATVSLPHSSPLENSGSLTGHILAQGWAEDPPSTRASTTRVVIVLATALGLLIAISLLVMFLANDTMSGITGNVLKR